ncbi:MAG: hypothetical protein QOE20_5467 [Mycobacterium sp.]|jgi:hypothetical protein|nr:hypothetical protein [Mycobacterium sp.]
MAAPDGVVTVGHCDYVRHRPDDGGHVRWTVITSQCTGRLRALDHIRQHATGCPHWAAMSIGPIGLRAIASLRARSPARPGSTRR